MELPSGLTPKKLFIVAFLVLLVMLLIVWGILSIPPNPICTGDLEVIDGSCQCEPGFDRIGNECYRQDIGKGVPNPTDECTLDPGAVGCLEDADSEIDSIAFCEDPLINIDQECVCPNNGWQIERDGQIFCLDVEEPLTEEQGLNQ